MLVLRCHKSMQIHCQLQHLRPGNCRRNHVPSFTKRDWLNHDWISGTNTYLNVSPYKIMGCIQLVLHVLTKPMVCLKRGRIYGIGMWLLPTNTRNVIRNQEFFISQHNKNMRSWKHLNTILNDIPIISVIFIINRKDKMYTKSGYLRP